MARHYTLVSPVGVDYLSIAVKKVGPAAGVPGASPGAMSNFLHTEAKPGDQVHLSPPFGTFGRSSTLATETLLFLSAGIGVTPVLAMIRSFHSKQHLPVSIILLSITWNLDFSQ